MGRGAGQKWLKKIGHHLCMIPNFVLFENFNKLFCYWKIDNLFSPWDEFCNCYDSAGSVFKFSTLYSPLLIYLTEINLQRFKYIFQVLHVDSCPLFNAFGVYPECTLLVLICFCPVYSELLAWTSVTKTFAILPEIIIEYQI